MKKLLALSLSALLLAGCAAEDPTPTTGESIPATEEVIISHDTLEIHELPYDDIRSAAPLGDGILLHTADSLVKLDSKNLKERMVLELDAQPVQVGPEGLCCRSGSELIFLNTELEETHRIALPDAAFAVSADLQRIYYCDGSNIRVIGRDTGLDRLLRETMHTGLTLEALELDDSVLVCRMEDSTLFYSAATGELLDTYEGSICLDSAGALWLADLSDNYRSQLLIGTGDADPRVLTAAETLDAVTPVPGLNSLLLRTWTEDSTTIRLLDPAEGTEAAVSLPGRATVTNAWSNEGVLWFFTNDGRLCRWDLEKTGMQDTASCFGPYYSRENPDAEGLAALASTVQEMEECYGVKIHIAEDAVTVQPEGMVLVSEYQVDALTACLEELELALVRFSPDFLADAGRASGDGSVHISLVRSAAGNGCFQFWDQDGVARIILAVGEDLQADFFHGLAHVIDARVMTECTAFDSWKSLNPKGFSYDYDHAADHDTGAFPGAFADSTGMISPVEDRASLFAHAMLADMDGSFESNTMQKKLSTLCTGIRKAFGLKNAEEALPWEQYLAE